MNKKERKYGRYTTKKAYEHAKVCRRRNARRWRKKHKAREQYDWDKSNTRHFLKYDASPSNLIDLRHLLDQRLDNKLNHKVKKHQPARNTKQQILSRYRQDKKATYHFFKYDASAEDYWQFDNLIQLTLRNKYIQKLENE